MASFEYLKISRSYLTDNKFMRLPDSAKWHYWGCYLLAGEAKSEGYISQNNKPMSIDDIAFVLRVDQKELSNSFDLLTNSDFVSKKNGFYFLNRFLDEQGPEGKNKDGSDMRTYWKETQQKHREKLKIQKEENKNEKQELKNKNTEKEQEEELRIRIRSVNDNVNDNLTEGNALQPKDNQIDNFSFGNKKSSFELAYTEIDNLFSGMDEETKYFYQKSLDERGLPDYKKTTDIVALTDILDVLSKDIEELQNELPF